jgi:hypothetical protein
MMVKEEVQIEQQELSGVLPLPKNDVTRTEIEAEARLEKRLRNQAPRKRSSGTNSAPINTMPTKHKRVRRKACDVDKKFGCNFQGCGKWYGSEDALKLHIRRKHKTWEEELGKFECPSLTSHSTFAYMIKSSNSPDLLSRSTPMGSAQASLPEGRTFLPTYIPSLPSCLPSFFYCLLDSFL